MTLFLLLLLLALAEAARRGGRDRGWPGDWHPPQSVTTVVRPPVDRRHQSRRLLWVQPQTWRRLVHGDVSTQVLLAVMSRRSHSYWSTISSASVRRLPNQHPSHSQSFIYSSEISHHWQLSSKQWWVGLTRLSPHVCVCREARMFLFARCQQQFAIACFR